ncbi:MAG TPA: PIG-L family deacetylase [Acidimicrobiales bacterium]|jgi:N-acetyl-1-D-myo-inositol-2-amino-2-deoxy-alpha-D-glucopyranoside deacetylase|nr:PIG-L family deacetylase [Acidimicrobiales bacterium]
MSTVVFVHAHPDDEAIATGGTMASLAADGHRVVLVTATVGELGEIPEGMLNDGESLADRRVVELAEAGRILGVARQAFLGYHDSGMAGEESNQRRGSFAAADVEEAANRLAKILDEEHADVVVIYDEHGGYGHPDHVQVHTVGVRAAEIAGTPRVFMATMDRGFLQSLAEQASQGGEEGWSPPEDTAADMQTMGEPSSRITTEVDVTKRIDAKRDAMRAHATQISEESFFLAMPPEVFEMVWGHEWYIRIRPEAPNPYPGPRETSLLGG